MGLDAREESGVLILTPHGMLLGDKETEALQKKIEDLDSAGNEKLLINLGKTTYMNSMGLAALIRAHASYAKRGAVVKICAADRRIRQQFALVRLGMVFGDNVHDTVEEALAAFQSQAAPNLG